jgi:hypothetical protein
MEEASPPGLYLVCKTEIFTYPVQLLRSFLKLPLPVFMNKILYEYSSFALVKVLPSVSNVHSVRLIVKLYHSN